MFTRKEHLAGACTHREYYAQFSSFFMSRLAQEKSPEEWAALVAEDEHLNNVPLPFWDDLSRWYHEPLSSMNNLINGSRSWSLSLGVCAAKEAAKLLAEGASNELRK